MSHSFAASALVLILLLMAGACSKKPGAGEGGAQKVELWRQQQMGKAVKYYQEIIESYPDSPFAAQARARIQAIGPVATPQPAAGAKR